MNPKKYADFRLEIGEPVVVAQAEPGDQVWGHFQFPRLSCTESGAIFAEWDYSTDTIDYDGTVICAVSEDGGRTWRKKQDSDRLRCPIMKNGKYFGGFIRKGAYPTEYLDKYTPAYTWGEHKLFFADDIAETADTEVFAREICPETGEETVFPCTIHWPNRPLMQFPGKMVYPSTMMFALCNAGGLLELDGEMYFVMYFYGFDAEAASREEAIASCTSSYSIYVFRSSDCGRSWEYTSQVRPNEEMYDPTGPCDGPCEPMMRQLPDGSVVMLMRTGSDNPSFIARSVDKCRTWSKPQRFDDIGVYPQLLPLACGVTLASYGRPRLKIRASSDPRGMDWEDPIGLPLSAPAETDKWQKSCFYTGLLPLNDREALLIYSDFHYPNADGIGVRSMLVRRITVLTGPSEK